MAKETKTKQSETEKKSSKRRTKAADTAVHEKKSDTAELAPELKDQEIAQDVTPIKQPAVKTKTETVEVGPNPTAARDNNSASDNSDKSAEIKRYDIMITSENAGYRPPKAGVGAIVQQLAYRGFASPVDEAIAETWTDIYFEPGPAAHEVFIEKNYSDPEPVFNELRIRFSDKPFFCDYSETPKRPIYFAIEIFGSRFPQPIGAFRKLFLDALNLRVTAAVKDAGEMPSRRIVSDDEKPFEKKKRERGAGIAGTDVEEM